MKKTVICIILFVALGCSEKQREKKKDIRLSVDRTTVSKLIHLKKKKKFYRDDALMYPGAVSNATRIILEDKINQLINRLLRSVQLRPYKSYVLSEFETTLSTCSDFDTEDRERICHYMEEIMDIFNIESSEGLLNIWMYGFDPSKKEQ